MGDSDWRPVAARETLKLRAELLQSVRRFFAERKVMEVETPALSVAGITDPGLEPVSVSASALPDRRGYLHTSPEYAMKRLLASGSGDIYQICRVFRDDETGRWHEPEFTLLEWYRVGWNELRLMDEVDELLTSVLAPHGRTSASVRLHYREVFEAVLGVEVDASDERVSDAIRAAGVDVPAGMTGDALLDLALSEVIAPGFEPDTLTFVSDYPASQAALARIRPGDPPVAARFELFCGRLEIANGFAELTDAGEQRARFEAELELRRETGPVEPVLDVRFLDALEAGLPDCAGVAVGLDRIVALAAGLDNVADTMTFPHR